MSTGSSCNWVHLGTVQDQGNGIERTAWDALLAHQTALRIKFQLPSRRTNVQSPTGAHTRTDAAIDTGPWIDLDLTRSPIEAEPLAFQPRLGSSQLIDISGKLHHHGAALVGGDLGPQDLGRDIEIHGQPIGDGLMHRLPREMQGEPPFQSQEPNRCKNLASTGKVHAMTSPPSASRLGAKERLLLVLLAAVLAGAVLWLRGGLHPEAPLERLARQSPDLQVALANGRPTVVEFYADWCEACRAMAPAMEAMEQELRGQLNVVLLNVDNPRWQPEMDRYAVNGIPQLELFNARGESVGRSIGARTASDLQSIGQALIEDRPLPAIAGIGKVSQLNEDQAESNLRAAPTPALAGPRSHA